MHPLDGPIAKLVRAEHHLNQLDRAIRRYAASNPFAAVEEFDEQKRFHTFTFLPGAVPPPMIGVVAGDVIHNIRSALDHIAWQLALLRTAEPHTRTEFPILIEENGDSRRAFKDKTKWFPSEARDIAESMQPYHRGNAAPDSALGMLHLLSIEDKHRLVVRVVDSAYIPVFRGPGGFIRELDDATVVVGIPCDAQPDVYFKPKFVPDIAFDPEGPGRGRIVLPSLRDIHRLAREDWLPKFAGFFPAEEQGVKFRMSGIAPPSPPPGDRPPLT